MIGLVSYLLVYVVVPFTAYSCVVSVTGSRIIGVLAGIISIVAAIVGLEVAFKRGRNLFSRRQ